MFPVYSTKMVPWPPGSERYYQEALAHFKINILGCLESLEDAVADAKKLEENLNYCQFRLFYNRLTGSDDVELLKSLDTKVRFFELLQKALKFELEARENAVRELEKNFLFQKALCDDDEFYEAYMAYGRIIPRQMEKKSSENMLVHPSQNEKISICFPESSSCASPTLGTFSSDSDNTSVSGTSSKRLPGPINVKGQDASLSSGNLKNLYMFWSGAILKNSLSDNPKSCEKEFEETVQKRPEQSPKPEFSKLEEVFAETKSESEKQMSPESDLTGTSDLKCLSSPNMQNESIANLQITADQQNEVPKNVDLSSAEKSSYQGTCILDHLNEKEKTENYNEMEFLLEESCDTKKAKSNIGVKRKMELPFQSKGKNICTDASEEKYSNSKQHSNICMEGEKKSSVDMIEEKTLN